MTTSCAENLSKILYQIRIQLAKRNREKRLETEQTLKKPVSLDPVGELEAPVDQELSVPVLPVPAFPLKRESDEELRRFTGVGQPGEKSYDRNDDVDVFSAGESPDEDVLNEDVKQDVGGMNRIREVDDRKKVLAKVIARSLIDGGSGGQHKCEYCGKMFSRNQNLFRHVQSHLNKREHHCEVCDKRFNTKVDLKVHSQTHEETKRFSCKVCGKVFKRSDNMARHVKIHVNDRAHKCITCGKGFNSRFNLKMHMKMHEGPKARIFACEYCGKSFYRRGSLIEHIRRCLNLKTYKCELCGKGFNNISGLNSHAAVHLSSKDFTCELCGKAFKRLLNMKNHLKVHLNEKQYKCEVCGKGCNTSSQLSMHKKMHTTGLNYSCEICGKGFKYRHSWKNHTATHSDEKRYQCNVCGKRYHSSSVLCSHRKYCNSNGEECTVCHQVIIGGRMNFKRHMKIHPLELPCEICGKIFKRKDILKRHMEIHLNERKYQCPICDKAFNTNSQLGMHRNKVHKLIAVGLSTKDIGAERLEGNEIPIQIHIKPEEHCDGVRMEEHCDGVRMEERCDGVRMEEHCVGVRMEKHCDGVRMEQMQQM